jgi:hypothetical protein
MTCKCMTQLFPEYKAKNIYTLLHLQYRYIYETGPFYVQY